MSTRSGTVLVIEDDRAIARMLRELLEAEGHRVLVEGDGEWGLRTFEHKPVDLIVLDLLLPKLNGFEVLERLRKTDKGRSVPVIVASGVYAAASHRAELADRHAVVEYFEKPLDIDRLLFAVRELLKQSTFATGDVVTTIPLESIAPSKAGMSVDPVLERGDLADMPFARLLGGMYAARATGALMLRKSAIKKIIYLSQGVPVFAKSNLMSECLARVMLQERLISESECERSVDRLKTERRRQGEILVEMGCISPANLEFALERQLEVKLFDVFSWLEGRYYFSPQTAYEGQRVALSMAPLEILYEGVRRTMSADRVARDLRRIEHWVLAPGQDPTFRYQALQLQSKAGALLDAIDGTRSTSGVLDQALGSRADASMLIYALTCTGLVTASVSGRPVKSADALAENLGRNSEAATPLARESEDITADLLLAHGPGANAESPVRKPPVFVELKNESAAIFVAEEAFKRGLRLAAEGAWGEAQSEFGIAARHNATEAAYLAFLAWAAFSADPNEAHAAERALAALDAAVERNAELEDAHVFRGLILERRGAHEAAVASFERALAVNPDSVRALRALRALTGGRGKKSGFWGRLAHRP